MAAAACERRLLWLDKLQEEAQDEAARHARHVKFMARLRAETAAKWRGPEAPVGQGLSAGASAAPSTALFEGRTPRGGKVEGKAGPRARARGWLAMMEEHSRDVFYWNSESNELAWATPPESPRVESSPTHEDVVLAESRARSASALGRVATAMTDTSDTADLEAAVRELRAAKHAAARLIASRSKSRG